MKHILGSLLGAACLVCSLAVPAVSLSPNGVGQVLIYPYYSVVSSPEQGAFNTLLSIVNDSLEAKVVKVRFREARAGAIVFEANVFLSVKDVWTAAVTLDGNGVGLFSTDSTCTRPSLAPGRPGAPTDAGRFTSDAFVGDPLGPNWTRMTEGFFEVLEMGTIKKGSRLFDATQLIAFVAKCGDIPSDEADIAADLAPPTGGLYGTATLVNVYGGTAFAYDAVALEKWSDAVTYNPPGTGRPTLGAASPPVSSIVMPGGLAISTWATGLEAVNAVLGTSATEVEFMQEGVVNGATDVVYVLPTKPLMVSPDAAAVPFSEKLTSQGACEPVLETNYGRDQQFEMPGQGLLDAPGRLCWVTTVRTFNAQFSVLSSSAWYRNQWSGADVPVEPTKAPSGVHTLSLRLTQQRFSLAPLSTTLVDLKTGVPTQTSGVTYPGLPLVGVSFVRYRNGTLNVDGVRTLSNYGAGSVLRTRPSMQLPSR